jgi:hypothetical protein
MVLTLFGLLIFIGVLRTVQDWRAALPSMVVLAAIQDPMRKLIPGTPGWLVLASALVVFAGAVQMALTQPHWWRAFRANYPAVCNAVLWLVLALLPAAVISASYGPGSWMFTLLGLASYSVIVLAVVMGYHFALSAAHLRRLLSLYCLLTAVMLSGSFVEYFGWAPELRIVGTKELGMTWVRHIPGTVVELIAGFYRSPDVMGWHASAAVMLASLLAVSSRGRVRWSWVLVALFAFGALMVCGRRKMVFMIPIFFIACAWLYWVVGRRGGVAGVAGVLLFPLISIVLIGDLLGDDSTHVTYYLDGATDTIDQVERHGFESVQSTFEQFGFFGAGLGFATPGAHNIPAERPSVWQESAPSRVMAELGVPGLLALLVLVVRLLQAGWWVTRNQLALQAPYALYPMGLLAFFMVNVGSLVVSGQILGDPFVATFLGASLGVVLAFGREPVVEATPPAVTAAEAARSTRLQQRMSRVAQQKNAAVATPADPQKGA